MLFLFIAMAISRKHFMNPLSPEIPHFLISRFLFVAHRDRLSQGRWHGGWNYEAPHQSIETCLNTCWMVDSCHTNCVLSVDVEMFLVFSYSTTISILNPYQSPILHKCMTRYKSWFTGLTQLEATTQISSSSHHNGTQRRPTTQRTLHYHHSNLAHRRRWNVHCEGRICRANRYLWGCGEYYKKKSEGLGVHGSSKSYLYVDRGGRGDV